MLYHRHAQETLKIRKNADLRGAFYIHTSPNAAPLGAAADSAPTSKHLCENECAVLRKKSGNFCPVPPRYRGSRFASCEERRKKAEPGFSKSLGRRESALEIRHHTGTHCTAGCTFCIRAPALGAGFAADCAAEGCQGKAEQGILLARNANATLASHRGAEKGHHNAITRGRCNCDN